MKIEDLLIRANEQKFLTADEGLFLYEEASTSDLIFIANELRKKLNPGNKVGWIIDRNVNITNVCICCCKFCNFHRIPKDRDTYITSFEEYKQKIDDLFEKGGDQLLLQGGCHPDLGLDFYAELFSKLKAYKPGLKLHALGPPEIVHLSHIESLSFSETLTKLMNAGLDSLPGAGAEILSDRVRKIVSPAKCNSKDWLAVMEEAHKLRLLTSATMMFGHVETKRERIEHLVAIRNLQAKKPADAIGFVAFIPWPFQDDGTVLKDKLGVSNSVSTDEYLRMVALSRIMLPNIKNIQASWLTVGKEAGQVCLHAGANDFGSIMIEENVVSSAGASFTMDAENIQEAIRDAGFIPQRRNQAYQYFG